MAERDIQPGDSVSIREGGCMIVREGDSRADLIAQGMKPEVADEVLDFRAYLAAKGRAEFAGPYATWKVTQERSEKQ